jgi:hypothetical protein
MNGPKYLINGRFGVRKVKWKGNDLIFSTENIRKNTRKRFGSQPVFNELRLNDVFS